MWILQQSPFLNMYVKLSTEARGYLESGLEVIKLEYILGLKIKRNDCLLVDTCQQAANQCALF